jgi:hypothetical protein
MHSAICPQSRPGPDAKQTIDAIATETLDVCGFGRTIHIYLRSNKECRNGTGNAVKGRIETVAPLASLVRCRVRNPVL